MLAGEGVDVETLATLVSRRRLAVRVWPLGARLADLVARLSPRPLLACAWAPRHGPPTSARPATATELAAPPCDLADETCPFETRRLAKLALVSAIATEPRAHRLLSRMRFSLELYAELNSLAAERGAAEGAREWLRRHAAVAGAWSSPERPPWLTALVPAECARSDGAGLRAAARLVRGAIVGDSGCDAERAVKFLTDESMTTEFGSLAAIVGPTCSGALRAVATQAAPLALPVIAYTPARATAVTATAAAGSPLVLAAGDVRDVAAALEALATEFGWRRLAALGDSGSRDTIDELALRANVVRRTTLPENCDLRRDYDAIVKVSDRPTGVSRSVRARRDRRRLAGSIRSGRATRPRRACGRS